MPGSSVLDWDTMAKAKHGDGSIVRRTDGRYQVSLMSDGKRTYRYTAPGAPRAVAVALLDAMKRDRDYDIPVPADRQTLADYLRRWLDEVESPKRRRPLAYGTRLHYRKHVDKHIIPALGHLRLDRVTKRAIQAWLDADTCGPRMIAHHHAVLRNALGAAARSGLIARNPVPSVEVAPVVTSERPVLTAEQAAKLFEATKGDRLHSLWVVALTTGMRASELTGLAFEDVDWTDRSITIGWQSQRQRADIDDPATARWVRVAPKTASSAAPVPLCELAYEALEQRRRKHAQERKPDWEFWGLVWPTLRGQPIHINVLDKEWYAALAKAKLPKIRFHDARHTTASILMATGMELGAVQKILRHSNERMTKHYAHVLPELSREAMRRMDAALGVG